jgi:hypothetical protein
VGHESLKKGYPIHTTPIPRSTNLTKPTPRPPPPHNPLKLLQGTHPVPPTLTPRQTLHPLIHYYSHLLLLWRLGTLKPFDDDVACHGDDGGGPEDAGGVVGVPGEGWGGVGWGEDAQCGDDGDDVCVVGAALLALALRVWGWWWGEYNEK